jgi:hypothetical protein
MEPLDLLIGPSSLPLVFQKKNVPYHLDLEKYPKSILENYVSFSGLGMNLAMKTNSIDQKKLRMFITSILRVGKKETSFAKNIHIFSSI